MTPTTPHPKLSRDTNSTLVIKFSPLLSTNSPRLRFIQIFYPDLIDKRKTPSFSVTPCKDNPEFCTLRFEAGPPYEVRFRAPMHALCLLHASSMHGLVVLPSLPMSVNTLCRTLHSRLSTVNGNTRGSMDSKTSFRTTYFSFGSASSATAIVDDPLQLSHPLSYLYILQSLIMHS